MGSEILKDESNKTFKDKLKLTLSGISGAFMLPISTLAVVAVFLSLGSYIESASSNTSIKQLGNLVKNLGYPLLQALPLFFCVAFTMSFCKNDSTCIWSSIIAFLVFLSVQGTLITGTPNTSGGSSGSGTTNMDNVRISGYEILFKGWGRDDKKMLSLVDRTLGITSLNTSIFGPFLIGGVLMPWIQKHCCNINLPGPLAFFSGKRFVPFIASISAFVLALLFLLFWPWIGLGFSIAGNAIAKTPWGVDSFIFGLLEKCLIPFGLHHMFYSPLWFSSLGGDVISKVNEVVKCGGISEIELSSSGGSNGGTSCTSSASSNTLASILIPTQAAGSIWNLYSGARVPHAMWQGDSFIGTAIISLPSDVVSFKNSSSSSLPVMQFFKEKLGISVGRFTQGKYPIMQFGLPAASMAMYFAAPVGKREEAKKILFPGILSSFLMGITEPLEFSFLFAAPKLFYGFHAVLCGISFWAMNVLGAHIPSIFSGGFLELVLLGALPAAKGTEFWWYLVVGIALAPIYFLGFYYFIRRFNIQTPGRDSSSDEEVSSVAASSSKVPEATRKLALALGGWENIEKMLNCASRLRYDIVDKSKVNEEALKKAGIIAVKWVGDNHLQAIVGPKAESINQEMIKWKGEKL